jgi:AraC family transcriptional regulator, transcriptional activator of pobA
MAAHSQLAQGKILSLPDEGLQTSFKIHALNGNQSVQGRTNCFAIYLFEAGTGSFEVDDAKYQFAAPALVFFNPYQKATFTLSRTVKAAVIEFHANFFCIETHHHAVGCNGVLFNNVYGIPLLPLNQRTRKEFSELIGNLYNELALQKLAHGEILTSYLKILLIRATRLKLEREKDAAVNLTETSQVLVELQHHIEQHYGQKHSPAEYAKLLNIPVKKLGKLVKDRLHRTLAQLIRDRILKHAKWQLLHTSRSIKEIAYEVGFEDEFYFSRLFKRSCGCSPANFRIHETKVRNGRNLSMPLSSLSIPSKSPER